jgi:penicillin-binding protein 1B
VRTRLAVGILAAFLLFTIVLVCLYGWYGFRVVTELRPASWRTPTQIIDRNGDTLLALYGAEWRVTEPVVLEKLPTHVPAAFLAAEDVRFRRHFGIDPLGVGRAALRNVRAGGIAEGGSTITQQLAKTHFLSAERTFTRKALEALVAVLIEARLSKDEILEVYLNDVYLGHRNGRGILGIDEASRAYFDKRPEKLTIAESAMLAGMIRAPNRDNPDERRKVAKQRRDAVLGVMRDRKWIDERQYEDAIDDRVRFSPGSLKSTPHPYLVAALRLELVENTGARTLRSGGLKIYTAVDRKMQRAAEDAVRGGTRRLRGRYEWLQRKEPLQAAILSVDPATGGIRALVGGSDFRKSQFDRTRRMRRQPGSAMKPFTYAAAIAEEKITAASVLEDKPVEIQLARNDIWRPQNYDERFRGNVTVREAFEKSLNTPAVRVADEVGVERVRDLIEKAGIEGELSDTPAVALGVDDVSMRELVGAYTIFPNLGAKSEPHLIDRIESASGSRVYRFKQRKKKVIDAPVAYVVHSLMRGVVRRGTASDLTHLGLGHIAGKTGTTNDYRDAWFVGYAPDLLTAAWVGFDDGTPLRISSAEAALPIWAAFMAKAPHEHGELKPPDGIELVAIEPGSGLLWQSGCGVKLQEAFLTGTQPAEKCRKRIEEPPIMIEFHEPAIITPEEATERSQDAPGLGDVEIVIDPAASAPADADDDPDQLNEEERSLIDQQLEEAMKRLEEQRRREQEAPPAAAPEAPPQLDRKEAEKIERGVEKQQEKLEKRQEKQRGRGRRDED